jgi:predicted ArsR family transcriptional regulator
MDRERSSRIDAIAALAEPVRRRLYDFVVGEGVPVDRDTAAAGAGVGRPLAAFHLDRLVEAGLLGVEFRRRSGRSGPGAGRPAKFYLRPPERDVAVSLPPRQYDLAAEILAEGIERRPESSAGVIEAARERGAQLAADAVDAAGAAGPAGAASATVVESSGREALLELLRTQGYEPFSDADGSIRLRNCPFHALVADHRQLTCAMNLAMLEAVAERVPETGLRPVPRPSEGFCCVAFVPDPEAPTPPS